jgi:hypothetical protein
MTIGIQTAQSSLYRQAVHWHQAAKRLSALDSLASSAAWHGVEFGVGNLLKQALQTSVDGVLHSAEGLVRQLERPGAGDRLHQLQSDLLVVRDNYLRAETTIYFYTVALNSRTTANVSALLRACDILCKKSMETILTPLGKPVPSVLTYIDKGMGAAILKAGLRLWDGSISPVAAIKVTLHNLFRPTSIIHEAGHQVAQILNWNNELSEALLNGLNNHPRPVRAVFAGWASEIAADTFAFAHAGYAAVAALHDVISGSPASVFAYVMGDPHPISYVRVLLGIQMCRQYYGSGPWDELEASFKRCYNIKEVPFPSVGLVNLCLPALPDVVSICLKKRYPGFSHRSLDQLVPPENTSPLSLQKLEYLAGPSLFTSHAWIWKECLRLLALNGLRIATLPDGLQQEYDKQQAWMVKLGFSVDLN